MIAIFTAAAVVVAWFVFRYDRNVKRREALDAAYGLLRAVDHGMVQGAPGSGENGWGHVYFTTNYTEKTATTRAAETAALVRGRKIDQVFVVATEPLAKLATTAPQDGLIESNTVATANVALWRVHIFNQLVSQHTDFNARHAAEIISADTPHERREELAEAAWSLSYLLHRYGIGEAAPQGGDAGWGWYGALVEVLEENKRLVLNQRSARLWRQLYEQPYTAIDLGVLFAFVAVIVTEARGAAFF